MNQYSAAVIGIIFEVLASFILALEAFSPKQSKVILSKITSWSKWLKKGLMRMIIFCVVLISPLVIAIIFENNILITLLLPISLLAGLLTIIVDHSHQIERSTMNLIVEKKLTPIGFVMLLIGNLFQLYSIIKQVE